MTAIVDR